MLKLVNVSKFYYSKGIVSSGITKVNLELNLGEFVAITGESGSGKSTLLNVISGLDSYEEGEMYINGKETSHYTETDFEDYRRKYISNIFQNFNLVNSYTVYQNVELVLLLNGYKKHDVKEKILDIIDQVGLTEFKNTKVSKLSGGQKQRVAIARAMVKDTPIIVADEPTGNLDSKSAYEVIEILKRVAKNKLVIVVTHNIEQVENIATKIIKMHDGRITEINEIKKINLDNLYEDDAENENSSKANFVKSENKESEQDNIKSEDESEKSSSNKSKKSQKEIRQTKNKSISLLNKYRLGFRNTFNIPAKFILLVAVFFFVASAIIATYGGFKLSDKNREPFGMSIVLGNTSPKRILINKKDRTAFDDELYEKIQSIENVDYIVKDDTFLDSEVLLMGKEDSSQDNQNINAKQLGGSADSIDTFKGEATYGRMPENENEAIVQVDKDKFSYIIDEKDDLLNSEFLLSLTSMSGGYEEENLGVITLVGISVSNDENFKYTNRPKIYFSNNTMKILRTSANKQNSEITAFMNNKYQDYKVLPSNKVESGKAIIDDDLKYEFDKYKAVGNPIKVKISNIYYTQELNLTIGDTYTKNNFINKTGYDKYSSNRNNIFINDQDYNSLFSKQPYQSSVFVKDEKKIDETIEELKKLGVNPKKATDFVVSSVLEVYVKMVKIIKTIVSIILIVALFFISYVIIKIILKSRNVYYTTLRMLGARMKDVKRILDIELFFNSTFAYLLFLVDVILIKNNIIKNQSVQELLSFIQIKDYIITYVMVVVMARLSSNRFAKKIFKKSAITTYNEEI